MKLQYNDRQHAYWFTPDGDDAKARRCKSITTVAKVPDDTYNLELWGKRQVALGMALDSTLAERAAAHHDDKSELNGIAEDAMRAAKSHQASARGTAVHRILERHDLGEDIIDTPESRAYRAAYDKALKAAGLEVLPEYVERIVVYPKHFIAGRFDRVFKVRRTGKLAIGDVKSGTNAVRYPHSTAVQLALYANATLMAGEVGRAGGTTEEFAALPDKLDTKWAYIVHAPDPEHVDVVKLRIDLGWDIARKAVLPILDWRALKGTDLIVPMGSVDVADLAAPAAAERAEWIKQRIALLRMTEHGIDPLVQAWPANVPTPKAHSKWTEADIDTIDAVLAPIERRSQAPFGDADPAGSNVTGA